MPDIEISLVDRIQVLRINRPAKKNALTSEMYAALSSALEDGDADSDVSAHVILGSGGVFTAGNDIHDFLKTAQGSPGLGVEVLRFIHLLPIVGKPLIAGADGAAIGIGTTLLLHCDLVYASDRAQFSTPFLNLGLVPEAASSWLMPQRMGYARAFELLVLGNTFSAAQALQAGLVNAVVPANELEATVMDAARRLAGKPAAALAAARRLMRGDAAPILKRTGEEAKAFAQQLATPEAKAAFESFLNKSRG
ncbi:MAG: crotonase/enoyl-CoA hydratase family protein [Hyphomicrobium sp.]